MAAETWNNEMTNTDMGIQDPRMKAFAFWRKKGNDRNPSFDEQVSDWLERNRKRLGAAFGEGDRFKTFQDAYLGKGGRRWFVGNVSLMADKSCRERDRRSCPFEGHHEDCVKMLTPCSCVTLRPDVTDPHFSGIAGTGFVPAIRCFISGCPHSADGASLCLDRLVQASDEDCLPWETPVEAELFEEQAFRLPAGRHNVLTPQFISGLSPVSLITMENLAHWRDYLDWRARLSRVRSCGLRMVSHKVDEESGEIALFLFAPDRETIDRALRSFHNGALIYGLEASTDPWVFNAADPERVQVEHGSEEGAPRARKRPSGYFESVKLGEMVRGKEEIRPAEGRVPPDCPYRDGYYALVYFEGSEESGKIPGTGFLVNDSVADEVLTRRLKRTVEEFGKFGSATSPRLPAYLFDVTRARVPEVVNELAESDWINHRLNGPQRRAVEKMLAAPDLALLQGPPGTGKTEVGTEATAQMVRRGERVLIASQSMAAVDNMIDRLPSDPAIRAVRVRSGAHGGRVSAKEATSQAIEELHPWYTALGAAASRALKERGDIKRRRNDAQACCDQLEPLAERLISETEVQTRLTAERDAAEAKVRAASIARREAETAAKQITAADRFAEMIETGTVGNDFEDVPEAAVSAVESKVNLIISDLRENGILVSEVLVGSSSALRAQALALAFDKFARIEACFGAAFRDLERLEASSSGVATTVVDTVRLAELDHQIATLNDRIECAFESADYTLAGRLGGELRKLQGDRSRLAAGGGLDSDVYRKIFTGKDVNGMDPVEELCRPGQMANSVAGKLRAWCEKFRRWSAALAAVRASVKESVASACAVLRPEVNVLDRLAEADAALRLTVARVKDSDGRIRGIRAAFDTEVEKASKKLGLKFAKSVTPGEVVSKVHAELDAANRLLADTDPGVAGDLMREWVKLTANPSSGDASRVHGDYRRHANVVGATCSTNFRNVDAVTGGEPFAVAIIDEVSKATPPELLAAMSRARKTVLMGDHRQLPPLFGEREPLSMEEIERREMEDGTVSEEVKVTLKNFTIYQDMVEASMFKDFFEKADDRIKETLTVQFRMHPQIMAVVNRFYDGKLACGLDPDSVEGLRDHHLDGLLFAGRGDHVVWLDSSVGPDGHDAFEDKVGTSFQNPLEARMIVKALRDIDAELERKGIASANAAVIAFYGRQKGLLKKCVQETPLKRLKVRVDTVDRFQGGEAPYVLVSMTRAPKRNFRAGEKAFVAKFERINVAFSRAQSLLMIFGSRRFFNEQLVTIDPNAGRNPVYRHIIESLDLNGRLRSSSDVLGTETSWRSKNDGNFNHQRKMARYVA